MAHEGLQVVVGTALVDPGFCRNLLDKAPGALKRFELTPEEQEIIFSIQAKTFQDFARELHRWINGEAPRFSGAVSKPMGERVAAEHA
jgi:hypothetical protein